MDRDLGTLTAAQLADLAHKVGIPLGNNPERTIGYYKQIGLLKPEVVQDGSVRRAYYSRHHLSILKIIITKKQQGLTLNQIKDFLRSHIFLSEAGRRFIEQFKDEYPESAFTPGTPVTRGEMAFFLHKVETVDPAVRLEIFMSAFVGADNEPIGRDVLEIAMLLRNQT